MAIVSVSLLSADGACLGQEVKALEKAGADWIHLDVMDGCFVPEITFGAPIINSLRSWTNLAFDVHLMVNNPNVLPFIEAGANLITFHPESSSDPAGVLEMIKSKGCKAGLAISPGHDYSSWPTDWWDKLDLVLVMTVFPGKAGQPFLRDCLSALEAIKDTHPDVLVSVDGGINAKTAGFVSKADVLVSGSFVFSAPYDQQIRMLKTPSSDA